ncbi:MULTISPECIES: endo alpha-1,4 polygalactosaminidase [Mesonia]|uniref:Uncharacterized protein n=1 Tax=Mesonia oceanica TaxID=2687242 RepID=A0AC61Y5W1_9FLAO|nr:MULTISPECIES: endo alpha-1,4 polygalactosaminidase [Mesonia]MAN26205.1 hypothetical protein [Mesonia sp.]MAQ42637.1 hypothetical protein [Mesonia sp.]VVU99825.1 hypothetical protein FVB9532_01086 [Mesonia oceanica]
MKKLGIALWIMIMLCLSCSESDDATVEDNNNIDYAQEMRDLVMQISISAKTENANFLIIPQNGIEIITENQMASGVLNQPYLNAIDGVGQEDLNYGYDDINEQTPAGVNEELNEFLQLLKAANKEILVTDYCFTQSKVNDAYQRNLQHNYIPFIAPDRELNTIPALLEELPGENANEINSFSEVKNFLYLLNTENFSSKANFIQQIQQTNYDLLITDLFFQGDLEFSNEEINQLKVKANGGKRLVVAYFSIGEAEDYRYYWKESWNNNLPDFIEAENPDWEGNFKVNYWDAGWQEILYGNENAYLSKILNAGFDGTYLDIIDAYQYFQE